MTRPTPWEAVSAAILLVLTALPIVLLVTVPWGWGVFAAVCVWPSVGQLAYLCVRGGWSWPRITGGPSIGFAGKRYGL